MIRSAAVLICLATLIPSWVGAAEGTWTPSQVLQLEPEYLKELGLELAPRQLWDTATGEGLLAATVALPGCTAAFVSAQGLLVTNHHCAFSILQQHSTPERDLISNGFVAASQKEELAGRGFSATVPWRFEDVTATVLAAVPEAADDLTRFRALERRSKELVAACEAKEYRRCKVAVHDEGMQYVLEESVQYPDVRLVWAPPRGIGEFGGEEDNWSWPRHTGDFTLLRVWAGADNQPAPHAASNIPHRPRHVFGFAHRGVQPGDFVMITGYPGRSQRSQIAAEVSERAELFFPTRAEILGEWLRLMDEASRADDSARIALASRAKGLANSSKNARGQLAGLARGRILESKRAAEEAVLAYARSHPTHAAAVSAHAELGALVAARRPTWMRDFLLSSLELGSRPLSVALTIARWSSQKTVDDLDRLDAYQARNERKLRTDLERSLQQVFLPVDQAILVDILSRLAAQPAGARSPAAEALAARGPLAPQVTEILAATRVLAPGVALAMLDESEEQLRARKDPLLELAFALDAERQQVEQADHRFQGAIRRLRPAWLRAVHAMAGRPVSPDANSTLRISFGHVKGYSPRDGVFMLPQTTLAGLVAKHTGVEPFDAPAALLRAAPQAPRSRWADGRLRDVPVAFLADCDTTGGNSGSPMLNSRGELVGVNFDRVWENVANDLGYNPEVARNVSVDARYLLWTLETLGGPQAGWLLAELGVTAVESAQ